MPLSNAERQQRFRERRIQTGEQVRLEFRVSKAQAKAFRALARRENQSQTQLFLQLLKGARQTPPAQPAKALRTVDIQMEAARVSPPKPHGLMQWVEDVFAAVSNELAGTAGWFKGDDNEMVWRLCADISKLRRRIQRRYPDTDF